MVSKLRYFLLSISCQNKSFLKESGQVAIHSLNTQLHHTPQIYCQVLAQPDAALYAYNSI